jgi:pheromone shutdown protein TraB
MVAALVEAWLRKPNVADCEELGEVSTLRDWYANRFTRVLLVGLGATVGSALGAYVGAAWVVKLL